MSEYQKYLDFLSEKYKSDKEEVVDLYESFKSRVDDLLVKSESQFGELISKSNDNFDKMEGNVKKILSDLERNNSKAINSSRAALETKVDQVNNSVSKNKDVLEETKNDLSNSQNRFSEELKSDLNSSLNLTANNLRASFRELTDEVSGIIGNQQAKINKLESTVNTVMYISGFTALTTLALLIVFLVR